MTPITAITVCTSDRIDYLRHSLDLAQCYERNGMGSPFGRRIIVMEPGDISCHLLHNDVDLVFCEYRDEATGKINIGKAINAGLAEVAEGEWVCRLDADTVLPGYQCELLGDPDPTCLYGLPFRWIDWRCYWLLTYLLDSLTNPYIAEEDRPRYTPLDCTRWADPKLTHQGFFQLWQHKASLKYPETTAAGEDWEFARKFAPYKRKIIEDGYAVHLGEPGLHRNGVIPFCEF